jgi:RNA polymerase sigma factor (TIGR02999 family)
MSDEQFQELLRLANEGDHEARDRLFEGTYAELHRIAHSRLRGKGRFTVLQTTSLVNEACLKMMEGLERRNGTRLAFLAYASKTMRNLIIDEVRRRGTERRGGDVVFTTADTDKIDRQFVRGDVLDVIEALESLAKLDRQLADMVEMHYFGGFTQQEIADALDLSLRDVGRKFAKASTMLTALLS